MAGGGAEEGDRVLLGGGDGDRREQGRRVRGRRDAVDRHDARNLQAHVAKVVDVARRLFKREQDARYFTDFRILQPYTLTLASY